MEVTLHEGQNVGATVIGTVANAVSDPGAEENASLHIKFFADQQDAVFVVIEGSSETITIFKCELEVWNGGAELGNGEQVGDPGAKVPNMLKETLGEYLLVNWDNDDASGVMNDDGSWSELPVPDLEKASRGHTY